MSLSDRLNEVRSRVAAAASEAGREPDSVELIAVSKTFDADAIRPALAAGQKAFGENRVQEAQGKWPGLKGEYPDIELHLIGPLQSNKTREAVALFDVIQTVDREKIARAIAAEMKKQDKTVRLYVEVNTGLEPQKAGIAPDDCAAFLDMCRGELGLTIEGLMCIPPFEENPGPHFALLREIAERNGIGRLSMGMSADFETAIAFGATSVRVGSAIFGSR